MRCAANDRRMRPKASLGRRILRREWSETEWGWALVTARYPRPFSVIPALAAGISPRAAPNSRHTAPHLRHTHALSSRHSRRPPLRHSRPRAGTSPAPPPTPAHAPAPAPRIRRPRLDLEPAPGLNRGPKPNPTRRRDSGVGCCSQRDTRGKRGYDGGGSVWWSAKDAGLSAKDAGEQGALGWRVACARFAVNGRATNHADSTHSVPAAIIASPFG